MRLDHLLSREIVSKKDFLDDDPLAICNRKDKFAASGSQGSGPGEGTVSPPGTLKVA